MLHFLPVLCFFTAVSRKSKHQPSTRGKRFAVTVARHLFLLTLQVQIIAPTHGDPRNSSFQTGLFVAAPRTARTESELVSMKVMTRCYLFSPSELDIVAFSTFICGKTNLIDESRRIASIFLPVAFLRLMM